MIRAFHGFLGSPRDFDFLKGAGVVLYDLYDELPETSAEDTLIGYSMGGRVAMELAKKNGFKKLILINAHPGLSDDKEREVRSLWEEEVLERLTDTETFLTWWNALPLFHADKPIIEIPQGSAELFRTMLLSQQENFLPFLRERTSDVHWILGEKDPKYSGLSSVLKDFDVHMVAGGHRLLQHTELLKPIIRKILA